MVFLSLYSGDVNEALSWDLRVPIALDVARGLEYLHNGVSLHVICNNLILLCMYIVIIVCIVTSGSSSCNPSRYQIFQHSVGSIHASQGMSLLLVHHLYHEKQLAINTHTIHQFILVNVTIHYCCHSHLLLLGCFLIFR